MPEPDVSAPRSRDFALSLQIADREHRCGQFENAVGIYRIVLSQCPDYTQAWLDLSRSLFALHQWPEAWAAFAHRHEVLEGGATPAAVVRAGLDRTPRMRAGATPGRLALVSEGGLGDIILFSRFAPRLRASGIAADLIAPARLLPLLRTLDPAPSLAAQDAFVADARFDAWAPLMDLPALMGLSEADLAAPKPYLAAEPARIERWRAWLRQRRGEGHGPTLAIAWRGDAENRAAGLRSAHLADFAPLALLPGVQLVCLQQDATDEEILACGFADRILRPGAELDADGAFLDSAALLMLTDRLISIDTALVHLAGALSRPCDVLLGEDPDWRWLDMAPGNVWHPTVCVRRCAPSETYAGLVARCAPEWAHAPSLRTAGRRHV